MPSAFSWPVLVPCAPSVLRRRLPWALVLMPSHATAPLRISSLWLPALAVFTAHNLEELIGIYTDWPANTFSSLAWTRGHWPAFLVAIALLTAFIGIFAYKFRENVRVTKALLKLFCVIMLANVLWHVGVTVRAGSISPGTITAVLINLPFYLYLLSRLRKQSA